jgi:hypothetical protein
MDIPPGRIHAVGKSFNHGWTQMNTNRKKDFSNAKEFTNRGGNPDSLKRLLVLS